MALIFPRQDISPTTITTIFPSPDNIDVPESMIGLGIVWLRASFLLLAAIIYFFFWIHFSKVFFFIGLVSPVIALSSATNSFAYITNPSAGTSIPPQICTTSPTKTKSWWISIIYPFLYTETTFFFYFSSLSFINCLSFW